MPVEVSVKPILEVRFLLKQCSQLKCTPIAAASSRRGGVLLGQFMELLGSYTDCVSGSLCRASLGSQLAVAIVSNTATAKHASSE